MLWWTLRQLKSKNWDTRWDAIEKLSSSRNPRAISLLIKALKNKDPEIRVGAMCALGLVGDPQAVEPLVDVLKHSFYRLNELKEAALALGKIGDPRAIEPLISVLTDPRVVLQDNWYFHNKGSIDEALRNIAPNWWQSEGALATVPSLVAALNHTDPGVRYHTDHRVRSQAATLIRMIDPNATSTLIQALKEGHRDTREVAADALGGSGDVQAMDPLIAALNDTDWGVAQTAERALDRLDPNWAKSEMACRAVPIFIEALKDSNEIVCSRAAEVLGKIGDERAVMPLVAALGKQNSSLPCAAAEALGKIGDARCIERLIAALRNINVQRVAEAALGIIDPNWMTSELARKAVPDFIAALKETDSGTRLASAQMLKKIGDDRAVEALIKVLGDNGSRVQQEATAALERINPEWAKSEAAQKEVPAFIAALKDGNRDIQMGATYALGRICGALRPKSLIEILKYESDEVGGTGVETFWETQSRARFVVETMVMALQDRDWEMRKVAADALKEVDPDWMKLDLAQKVVPNLIAQLKGSDFNVRSGAAELLGKVGDERAVEPLIAYVQDAIYERAVVGVSSLEQVLKRAGSKITTEHLRILASMRLVKDCYEFGPIRGVRADFGPGGPPQEVYRKWKQEVNCSLLNKLALQVLNVRGG